MRLVQELKREIFYAELTIKRLEHILEILIPGGRASLRIENKINLIKIRIGKINRELADLAT